MEDEKKIAKVTASELEEQIFDKEGVRIVIRAGKDERFDPYDYKKKASATMSKTNWYMSRVKPLIGDRLRLSMEQELHRMEECKCKK